ncbi:MAG TPA: phytoene/squalene synthase family protein [Acidimicrobiales bacterium]|nr:phytoene/squalene synthase family protein [Acidimicrobiales bacterium]
MTPRASVAPVPVPAGPVTLAASYRYCREINRRHGTSYFWATRLLPAASRPHVHALYGFCRYADDIVDDLAPAPTEQRAAALADLGRRLQAGLAAGDSDDPLLKAVVHSILTLRVDGECFTRFLRSMTMDLTVAGYDTYEDLLVYMDGSAAVIGEMMLPVLQPLSPDAIGPARDLGLAFQLTNFLRDVAEDLDRGRVYLPREDIERFGAGDALARRAVTPEWVALMAYEIARTRRLYESADTGIAMLPPASARCVAAARTLYHGILERIEAAGYDVFSRRARVPAWRKAAVVVRVTSPPRRARTMGSSIP